MTPNSTLLTETAIHNESSTVVMSQVESVLYDIETYYLWVILGLGFPGNCATIVTVIKMSPARSLTVYIALLAVVDNLSIINKLLIFVLPDHRVNIGDIGCKFLGFSGNFLITFGNWLLVAMSIERFAAVWFPLKVGQMWTFKKSLIAVVLLSLPLFALFLHLFWSMNIVDDEKEGIMFCDIREEFRYFMQHVWFWINIMIYAVVPCILLLIFNVLTVIGIVRSGKIRRYLNNSHNKNSRRPSIDRNRPVTIMLVTAAITLVVLTTPRCVMLILSPYFSPQAAREDAAIDVIDTMAYVLCDSTHAINFYVYSLSAKRFRNHFIDLFCCKSSSQYGPVTSKSSLKHQMSTLASQKRP